MAPHLSGTILVIDDEPSIVRALAGLLRRDGYIVSTASNGRYALAQLQARRYDALLCDLQLPDLDGPALYAIVRSQSLSGNKAFRREDLRSFTWQS
jgi:CheY-like chemotaxis protein